MIYFILAFSVLVLVLYVIPLAYEKEILGSEKGAKQE